ncbi:KTSC domain-containing protein [Abyssisolibacter fermentans]|uniref:KTSC domain-containing protein n=1 Tax=Abyssisolibacter fermentans TaxID=1766203 RepID=UPI0008373519|nr:KTSC domain-containing protein [Abyssisolibacter fermentans]
MNNVEMIPVSSSNVDSVGYDETNQIAYVRFLNGTLYIYKGVPQFEYEGLLNAPSVGSYLHRNFKNVYPYERIE